MTFWNRCHASRTRLVLVRKSGGASDQARRPAPKGALTPSLRSTRGATAGQRPGCQAPGRDSGGARSHREVAFVVSRAAADDTAGTGNGAADREKPWAAPGPHPGLKTSASQKPVKPQRAIRDRGPSTRSPVVSPPPGLSRSFPRNRGWALGPPEGSPCEQGDEGSSKGAHDRALSKTPVCHLQLSFRSR